MKNEFCFEVYTAMAERTIRRLWILCIILIVLIVTTNIAWLYYESQFENISTTTIDTKQDGTGINLVSGGDMSYGAEGKNHKN